MNPDPIIQIIIQVLLSLTLNIWSGFGGKIGESLAEAPVKLHLSTREKNKRKSEVKNILIYLLKSPSDVKAREIFGKKLAQVLEQDSSLDFLEQLRIIISMHQPILAQELSPVIEVLQPALSYELRQ